MHRLDPGALPVVQGRVARCANDGRGGWPVATAGTKDPEGAADGEAGSVRSLKALNFTIADVQNGMGPYVALFLQSQAHWSTGQVGTVLTFGNIAQVIAQTPAGVLIDRIRQKRGLIAIGIVMIAIACITTPLMHPMPGRPARWTLDLGRPVAAPRRIGVTARSADGRAGDDEIRLEARRARSRAAPLGHPDASIGESHEHGLLGTRLGPNADGRKG